MPKSIDAIVEQDGSVRLNVPIQLKQACRAVVTIFEDEESPESALLSEGTLAEDWTRPEEGEAWSHLQQAP
jgi:hypothetical protein